MVPLDLLVQLLLVHDRESFQLLNVGFLEEALGLAHRDFHFLEANIVSGEIIDMSRR